MADNDRERLKIAGQVRRTLAVENTLSAVQARAFVRCLQKIWEVPPIQWSEQESEEIFADARRLLHAAEIYRQIEGRHSPGAIDCYRRAGELLEWLSRAEDKLRLVAPIELFAAAALQLGGLPAMATGLLRQVDLGNPGTQLYASFLQADFDGVVQSVMEFWGQHPDLTTRDAPRKLLLESEDEGRIAWYFTTELVRSIGLIAESLRRGDSARLARAIDKLDALEKMSTRIFSEDASLLTTLIRAVADNYREASIYLPVKQLADTKADRATRLLRFARDQFSRGRGVLWPSQRDGLRRLLDDSSFALCTPTGSGKTLVANIALVKELLLRPDEDVIDAMALYLVPSRALAGEVETKLRSELGEDLIITGLYGGADWGITDYWLKADKPTVLIATVEKAEALMRYVGPLLLARLRLLVIDEAHQVVPENNQKTREAFADHSSRSLRLEGFVSRLLSLAPDIARIALTAVAGGGATPVARWIEGQPDAVAVGTRYQSTRQLIGVLETTLGQSSRILLEIMNGQALYVRDRDEPVYLPLRIPPMARVPLAMRNSLYRFNELSVLWTALHLVDEERRILISVAQKPEQTMRWYKEALELQAWAVLPVFTVPAGRRRERFNEARAVTIDYCGPDSYEIALLDRGIATSHGQMPQRLRRLMTEMIEQRICPITVATATLTEGVNLPFDIIFLTSLKRRSFNPMTQRPIITPLSTAEFRNLAGRAGRPGASKGIEGMTLIAIPQRVSASADATRQTQRRQRSELNADYRLLREHLLDDDRDVQAVSSPLALLLNLIATRAARLLGIYDEDFLEWLDFASPGEISDVAGRAEAIPSARLADSLDELDGVLLSAIEELNQEQTRELTIAQAEAHLVQLWQKTFTNVAAVQEEWLETAFIRRGRALIENIYPDGDERKRLYLYGFTPYVGRRFEGVAQQIHELIMQAVDYGGAADADRLVIFENIGALVANDRGFGFRIRNTVTDQRLLDDWPSLLAWWMQGVVADFPDPSDLRAWQRFVTDNLEFRLGVAIGAVVARAWTDGVGDPLTVPTLEKWRATTGLPWFGFWARELLRWGTLDPFVAFVLAQGLAKTRNEATAQRADFEKWLNQEYENLDDDDMIDPQLFLAWQRTQRHNTVEHVESGVENAKLTGTDGQLEHYAVVPVRHGGMIHWIDAAGYELARSRNEEGLHSSGANRNDFELRVRRSAVTVKRTFTAHS
ncbi:DEAD/DEAH box helicase [Pectobacterium carotovorum subsp. carotovorum]|uniref:DEAD/DEAH box helicase n=1 Tax=Pectobacterium carotovorum TaxID=554 RepID=UPI002366C0B4|nr:DEAD/DEAH box helicase [Pectobacterium carotovorum]WDF97530.1 DEAD/DEAH box helicase [Pectobacterium carotovorum subsp. carotovorum]